MKMETIYLKNLSQNLPFRKFTQPINLEHPEEIQLFAPYFAYANLEHYEQDILTQIYLLKDNSKFFLLIITFREPLQVVEVLENTASALAETLKTFQSTGNLQESFADVRWHDRAVFYSWLTKCKQRTGLPAHSLTTLKH